MEYPRDHHAKALNVVSSSQLLMATRLTCSFGNGFGLEVASITPARTMLATGSSSPPRRTPIAGPEVTGVSRFPKDKLPDHDRCTWQRKPVIARSTI